MEEKSTEEQLAAARLKIEELNEALVRANREIEFSALDGGWARYSYKVQEDSQSLVFTRKESDEDGNVEVCLLLANGFHQRQICLPLNDDYDGLEKDCRVSLDGRYKTSDGYHHGILSLNDGKNPIRTKMKIRSKGKYLLEDLLWRMGVGEQPITSVLYVQCEFGEQYWGGYSCFIKLRELLAKRGVIMKNWGGELEKVKNVESLLCLYQRSPTAIPENPTFKKWFEISAFRSTGEVPNNLYDARHMWVIMKRNTIDSEINRPACSELKDRLLKLNFGDLFEADGTELEALADSIAELAHKDNKAYRALYGDLSSAKRERLAKLEAEEQQCAPARPNENSNNNNYSDNSSHTLFTHKKAAGTNYAKVLDDSEELDDIVASLNAMNSSKTATEKEIIDCWGKDFTHRQSDYSK